MKLEEFLARVEEWPKTDRYKRLCQNNSYWNGRQYEGRDLDEHGYIPGTDIYGNASLRTPPMNERRLMAVHNVPKDIVKEITNWAVSGSSWCKFKVDDDEAAEEWANEIAELSDMASMVAEARNMGGGVGTAVVSAMWDKGLPLIEVHNPMDCWVLRWQNERRFIPAEIVKITCTEDDFQKAHKKGYYTVRYWSANDGITVGEEVTLDRVQDKLGQWVWVVREKIAHGFERCPVFWAPNTHRTVQHDGLTDYESCEAVADRVNELFAAADQTTIKNADGTVVVKEDPALNNGPIRIGGYNTIFSRGGAEILEQKGDSARICMELAEKREDHIYRLCGIIKLDINHLAKATSGEALRRLLFNQLNTCDQIRAHYKRVLIVPLVQWFLDTSRELLARGEMLDIAPAVRKDDSGIKYEEPKSPGESNNVRCIWPSMVPDSWVDKLAATQTAVQATTGGLISKETGAEILESAGIEIDDHEEELDKIEEEADAAQDRAVGAAQSMAEIGNGSKSEDESEDESEDDG